MLKEYKKKLKITKQREPAAIQISKEEQDAFGASSAVRPEYL